MTEGVTLAAEKIGQIGNFPITNSLLTTWLVTIILIAFAFIATRKVSLVPTPIQNFAEFAIESLRNMVESVAGEKTKVFFPIIASFFFFILVGNYLGLLPGVGTIGFWETPHGETINTEQLTVDSQHLQSPALDEHPTPPAATDLQPQSAITQTNQQPETSHQKPIFVPLFRSINSDLNTTLALALVSVITTHFFAVKYLGLGEYLKKWFPLHPIMLFVGLIEVAGEFTKIISLSFRLFGNIYAGETVLTTASSKLFAFIVPIPFLALEIIVGFVQALVFAMLTLVFMVILTTKHEH